MTGDLHMIEKNYQVHKAKVVIIARRERAFSRQDEAAVERALKLHLRQQSNLSDITPTGLS
jgi:hypothetical protein